MPLATPIQYRQDVHDARERNDEDGQTAIKQDVIGMARFPRWIAETNDDRVASVDHFRCPTTVKRFNDGICGGVFEIDPGAIARRTVDKFRCWSSRPVEQNMLNEILL